MDCTISTIAPREAGQHYAVQQLKDYGDKVSADERSKIESAVAALKEALKGQDLERIKTLTQELEQASYKMAEAMYAGAGQGGGLGGPGASGIDPEHGMDASGGGPAGDSGSSGRGDDVVDAEFRTTDEL